MKENNLNFDDLPLLDKDLQTKILKGNLTYFENNGFHTYYGELKKYSKNRFELKKENGKLVIGNCENWIFEED